MPEWCGVPLRGPAANVFDALANRSTLLMKEQIATLGKNYQVMDENQSVLCRVTLDSGQNLRSVAESAIPFAGRYLARRGEYTYVVVDGGGQPAFVIAKGQGTWQAQFDVFDASRSTRFGTIQMKHGFMGGLEAQWIDARGQLVLRTQGNVIRRQYEMVRGDGQPGGSVRHQILAIRDVWQLVVAPGTDPLHCAVFATILDFEKER